MNENPRQSRQPLRISSVMVLQEESPDRMLFALNAKATALGAFIAGVVGAGMTLFIATHLQAVWFPVTCFGILSCIFFLAAYKSYFSKQTLALDNRSQTARFVYAAPGDSFQWTKSFSEFKTILLLRHHSGRNRSALRVELVPQEGESLHLGYRVIGSASDNPALELAQKLSDFTGIEISRKD